MRQSKKSVIAAMLLSVAAVGASVVTSAAPVSADDTVQSIKDYYVTVRTGDRTNAGTDADISSKVYGSAADSPGYFRLDSSADDFERNSTRQYGPFLWNDVGNVYMIALSKKSNGSEWYVDYAQVYSPIDQRVWHCPVNSWFPDGANTQWFACS